MNECGVFVSKNVVWDRPIVFCFHHAGGNAHVSQKWKSNKVSFIPIELPGHGSRSRETAVCDIEILASDIARSIAKLIYTYSAKAGIYMGEDKRLLKSGDACLPRQNEMPNSGIRFSLFGHSLGAILAYTVTLYLLDDYGLAPDCLIVAGRQAPGDEDPSPYRTSMGKDALADELRSLGHTPTELLDNDEYREFLLSMIYNDYLLGESYHGTRRVLPIPIHAFCSDSDRDAGDTVMSRWKLVTSKDFKLTRMNGDHFFIFDERLNFHKLIESTVLEASEKSNLHQDAEYESGCL